LLGGRSDTPSTDGTGVVRTDQTLGSATVRGSIHGGTQQDSGLISAAGNVGAVRVLGSIVGGSSGTSSGGIFVGGNVTTITVKGDVIGGGALDSGVIHVAGKSGAINLLGGLTGGAGEGGGSVWLGTSLSDNADLVSIARDVTGGAGDGTGAVHVAGKLGTLNISGSVHGGPAQAAARRRSRWARRDHDRRDLAGGTGADSGRLIWRGRSARSSFLEICWAARRTEQARSFQRGASIRSTSVAASSVEILPTRRRTTLPAAHGSSDPRDLAEHRRRDRRGSGLQSNARSGEQRDDPHR